MFDPEFYPTPIGLVKRMIYPYVTTYGRHKEKSIKNRTILEPSAGKGDILDGIKKRSVPSEYDRDENGNKYVLKDNQQPKYDDVKLTSSDVYCIEKNPELQMILKEKGYSVIADDFLTYKPTKLFDLIIMNPPFSNGDEHLLHAWEVLYEGDIVCLLNAETVNNPYSTKRKTLLNIINEYGKIEHLGQAFKKSDRETNVEVVLIRLHKKLEKSKFDFDFSQANTSREKEFYFTEENFRNGPAMRDTIGNMIIQYEKVKEEFVKFMQMFDVIRYYGAPLVPKDYYGTNPKLDVMSLAVKAVETSGDKKKQYNAFSGWMNEYMWETVFQNIKSISSLNIESIMTSSIRNNWNEFLKDRGKMDFTKENVWNVIDMIFSNRNTILERCIVEVFDLLTRYHKENRMIVEGWKTNDCWKVNRKFILPNGVRYGEYCVNDHLKKYGDKFRLQYSNTSSYTDIDKAMAYIKGYNGYTTIGEALERKFEQIGTIKTGDKFDNECYSTFFQIKFFRKGTVHCQFIDEKLWQEFNMRACADKNWLPPAEKKMWEESKQKPEEKKPETLMLTSKIESLI